MLNYHILSHSSDIHEVNIKGELDAGQDQTYTELFYKIRKEVSDKYFRNKYISFISSPNALITV